MRRRFFEGARGVSKHSGFGTWVLFVPALILLSPATVTLLCLSLSPGQLNTDKKTSKEPWHCVVWWPLLYCLSSSLLRG